MVAGITMKGKDDSPTHWGKIPEEVGEFAVQDPDTGKVSRGAFYSFSENVFARHSFDAGKVLATLLEIMFGLRKPGRYEVGHFLWAKSDGDYFGDMITPEMG
jgi:hypothetical protein